MANVTAGLAAACAASTIAEFAVDVVVTDNTTDLLITAVQPGVPFTQSSSASGGSATLTTATVTRANPIVNP